MEITTLIVIAILVEAIWENLKMVWQQGKLNINMVGALILSILICILAGVNIFELLGVTLACNVVGNILTGIIVSRGANFVNDLFSRLRGE